MPTASLTVRTLLPDPSSESRAGLITQSFRDWHVGHCREFFISESSHGGWHHRNVDEDGDSVSPHPRFQLTLAPALALCRSISLPARDLLDAPARRSQHARMSRSKAFSAGALLVLLAACTTTACSSSDSADPSCVGCGADAGHLLQDASGDSAAFDAVGIPDAGDATAVEDGGDAAVDGPADGALESSVEDVAAEAAHDTGADTAADATELEAGQDGQADAPSDGVLEDVLLDAPWDGSDAMDATSEEASTSDGPALDGPVGVITGGPCLSGAAGQTAYRVRWIQAGSTAQVVYEVNGLPDPTDHTGVYGYSMGFTPQFVDPYLGEGGVLLDSSDFIDIELSTAGIGSISSITLSLYGRSFNTTASGSFDWQTFEGAGAAPSGLVSNVAPYEWYSTDLTSGISAGNGNVLLRIKSGPPSDSLVVNRVEICMEAQ